MLRRTALSLVPMLGAARRGRDLFDGKSLMGWRAPFAEIPLEECWRVRDGAIETIPDTELKRNLSTDLWTIDNFTAFDLIFEYWAAPAANGGLKFQVRRPILVEDIAGKQRVIPAFAHAPNAHIIAYSVALEFQVSAPDEPDGLRKPTSRAGSLYNKAAAPATVSAKAEAWNLARIRLEPSGALTMWLNGETTVSTSVPTPLLESPIVLQHHGSFVRYRNLRIEPRR
jgi:hypothetical protein